MTIESAIYLFHDGVAVKSKPPSRSQASSQPQSSQATTTPPKPIVGNRVTGPYARKNPTVMNQVKGQPTGPLETIDLD